jgi:hypothetical protein
VSCRRRPAFALFGKRPKPNAPIITCRENIHADNGG